MNQYLAWFDEIPDGELAMAAGGKGASLCRMSRAGLPVPEGFIVRSEMFNAFMEANGLWDYVFEKLGTIDFSSDASLIAVSAEIRRRIIDCPVPQDMAEDIVKHYSKIGSGREPVAVRSSGTAEDLDDASFAGQQETFLFVIGNDDVVKFIKECWASLYNDRAIFYRREKKFDERSISIAVVVQRMVSAQKAGVMFTSNPITNDYNTVVLEAAWGLGEAIVSGIVTPDNLWIDKRTGEVTTEYISEKETMVVRLSERGGTKEEPVPEELREAPVLTDAERNRLVELARKIEDFYKKPEDIEWAIVDGQVYLLQSRPITTMK
ncbi:PEP/pyruvate-binding domain-containing protein [uncultured Oscillibacter sp.]|uniref:PEP/pyruvate-binding domain-containing protein n=1 Tax=uncultured Oscillibacter sp. TaxID=876091 RepID=UPI0026054885|nr:PEP/pyruvate-binding domain-containing protein [uncultured Oscillibacter sp.]